MPGDRNDEIIELERRGDVWVLHQRNDENRFNRASIGALHAALDEIESTGGPAALVTTGDGRFYSNGLDLEWLLAGGDETEGFLPDVHRLLGRVLGLDVVTVAAINGHAFAGGAMLASAHDYRVMREDRGYWCLPEVDLGLPLTPGMYAVLAAHVPRPALRVAALTGKRFTGPEALAAGIVDELAAEADVVDRAVVLAAELAGKNRDVIAEHKRLMYGDAMLACGLDPEPLPPPERGSPPV
jgi:Delta3-Delta2-enoyl-CoA isomerase